MKSISTSNINSCKRSLATLQDFFKDVNHNYSINFSLITNCSMNCFSLSSGLQPCVYIAILFWLASETSIGYFKYLSVLNSLSDMSVRLISPRNLRIPETWTKAYLLSKDPLNTKLTLMNCRIVAQVTQINLLERICNSHYGNGVPAMFIS
jgi:hypothetical protein